MTATTLALLTQCLLALAAFSSLCLATPRHIHRLKFARHPRRWRNPLRAAAIALFLGALYTAMSTQGRGLGLVDWFGALTLAAFIVIAAATYRPQWLGTAGVVGSLTGVCGLVVLCLT